MNILLADLIYFLSTLLDKDKVVCLFCATKGGGKTFSVTIRWLLFISPDRWSGHLLLNHQH